MIYELTEIIRKKQDKIDKWFEGKKYITQPIYCSFDIRNFGHKAVVVDSNVFPAGFNNLCEKSRALASKEFRLYIDHHFEKTDKIGLIAEVTNNTHYYDNIIVIKQILEDAGFEVRTGAFGIAEKMDVSGFSEGTLVLNAVKREGNKLLFDCFVPDLILLNDDFSTTDPKLLEGCRQPVAPAVELGWFRRKKHKHFAIKNRLIKEISELIDIDRCFIGAYFEFANDVHFKTKEGFDKIAAKIDKVICQIQKKYDEYGIKEKPFVFVKGDSSTYGMNAIPFHSGKEFLEINSKTRAKLHKSKGGRIVTEIMIQEGVPTIDIIEDKVAEPVVYCVGGKPVGGFFRVNPARSVEENLNSRGMRFTPDILCPQAKGKNIPKSNITKEKIMLYNFLARLGSLAIGYETKELK